MGEAQDDLTRQRRKAKGGLHVTGARVWRDSVPEGGEEERAFIQRPSKLAPPSATLG